MDDSERLKSKLGDCILRIESLEGENKSLRVNIEEKEKDIAELSKEVKSLKELVEKYKRYDKDIERLGVKDTKELIRGLEELIVDIQMLTLRNIEVLKEEVTKDITIKGSKENIDKLDNIMISLRAEVVDKETLVECLKGSLARQQEELHRLTEENTELVYENSFTELYNKGKTVKELMIEEKKLKYTTYKKEVVEEVNSIYKEKNNLSYQEVANILIQRGKLKYISKTSIRKIVKENSIDKIESKRGRKSLDNN